MIKWAEFANSHIHWIDRTCTIRGHFRYKFKEDWSNDWWWAFSKFMEARGVFKFFNITHGTTPNPPKKIKIKKVKSKRIGSKMEEEEEIYVVKGRWG